MKTKTILITGAATGFGRDTAQTLARKGHSVFAGMRDVDTRNRSHAEALRAQSIDVVELDVANDASVDTAIARLLTRIPRLDVLINNAGIASAGVTEAFTPDQVKLVFNTNVLGILRTTRAVLPTLRRQREGLIINISSILGRVTFPFFGIYGASKFAVEALSDSLRYELSASGVEVALLQPSAYPTAMYGSIQQPEDSGRVAEYGPIGQVPVAMFRRFTELFQGPDAPDPHDVARTIEALIALPSGQRPSRTIVGASFGADAVNRRVAPVQSQVVRSLGLGHLDVTPTH